MTFLGNTAVIEVKAPDQAEEKLHRMLAKGVITEEMKLSAHHFSLYCA